MPIFFWHDPNSNSRHEKSVLPHRAPRTAHQPLIDGAFHKTLFFILFFVFFFKLKLSILWANDFHEFRAKFKQANVRLAILAQQTKAYGWMPCSIGIILNRIGGSGINSLHLKWFADACKLPSSLGRAIVRCRCAIFTILKREVYFFSFIHEFFFATAQFGRQFAHFGGFQIIWFLLGIFMRNICSSKYALLVGFFCLN